MSMRNGTEASGPGLARASAGVAVLSVLVLAGSVALFIHSSCAPAGATKTPRAGEPAHADTEEPDPEVDLQPPPPRLGHPNT